MVRSDAEVERLVHENQKLVQHIVSRYLKKYFVGAMEREDLLSWGLIGLVQAARVWDPRRGSFATIACKAIERMIVRGVRREWKPEQAAATLSLDDLISGEAGEPRFGRAADSGGGRAPGQGARERFVDRIPAAQDLQRELLEGEARSAVRSAVAELPAPQRRLIERHYYEEVPVARLAEELGMSRQGLYARKRQALRQLRAALSPSISGGSTL